MTVEHVFLGWWQPPEFNARLAKRIHEGWEPSGDVMVSSTNSIGVLIRKEAHESP